MTSVGYGRAEVIVRIFSKPEPAFTTFSFDVKDGIAVAVFSRPEQLNTFSPLVMAELITMFDVTDADDDVRAVIVTGSGRAFCAGADLNRGPDTFNSERRRPEDELVVDGIRRDNGGRLALRVFGSLKPVIAAVNGAAIGIGATLQLPMDARVASTDAKFGFVFTRRGITPEACSSWFLPRLVGVPKALEWIYSGRVFDAHEALEAGLVQSLHAPNDLMAAARELACRMTESSAPVSVALSRQLIWRMLAAAHPSEAHLTESRALQARGGSADAREGISAFKQRRTATYADQVSASHLGEIFGGQPGFG